MNKKKNEHSFFDQEVKTWKNRSLGFIRYEPVSIEIILLIEPSRKPFQNNKMGITLKNQT